MVFITDLAMCLALKPSGQSIDCHVEQVAMTYDRENGEQFDIRLQGEQ